MAPPSAPGALSKETTFFLRPVETSREYRSRNSDTIRRLEFKSRILSSQCYRGNRLFNFAFPHFQSPHSGRSFPPHRRQHWASRHRKKSLGGGQHVAANSTIAWPSAKSRRFSSKLSTKSGTKMPRTRWRKRILFENSQNSAEHSSSTRQITRTIRLLSSPDTWSSDPHRLSWCQGIQLEEALKADDDLVKRSPEEIINKKRQAWIKDNDKKTWRRSKEVLCRTPSHSSTGFLHLNFSQEEDSDGSPVGPMLSDTLGQCTFRRLCPNKNFSILLVCGVQKVSALMRHFARTLPRRPRMHWSEFASRTGSSMERQLPVRRHETNVWSDYSGSRVFGEPLKFLVKVAGGSIGRSSRELRLIPSFSHYATHPPMDL